jgi:flagellar hook assembly protein FlgD
MEVWVYNINGNLVTRLNPVGNTYVWDGRDSHGIPRPAGTYIYKVKYLSKFLGAGKMILDR